MAANKSKKAKKAKAPNVAARKPKAAAGRARAKKPAAKKPAAKKSRVAKARSKVPARKVKAPAKKGARAARKPASVSAPARASASRSRAGAKKAAAQKPARSTLRREDRAGHLDAGYAAELRERGDRPARDPSAFIGRARASDSLVEELGEEYVTSATSGEYEAEDARDQQVPEELGGPFVQSTAGQEFADGIDASNPIDATQEPFPKT